MRYDRELVQTTVKAMKRIAEIKQKREHAFWRHRMAASREKLRAHRKQKLQKASVKLVQPVATRTAESEMVREKIKVPVKAPSALVPGEGRSMGMDID